MELTQEINVKVWSRLKELLLKYGIKERFFLSFGDHHLGWEVEKTCELCCIEVEWSANLCKWP